MELVWENYPNAVQTRIAGIPPPYDLMQQMAAYFLQFQPDMDAEDLYLLFLRHLYGFLDPQDLLFATLNYENLLEFALVRNHQPRRVLRPHGAVDWWVREAILRPGNRAIGAGYHFTGRSVRPIPRNQILSRMAAEGKYPVMAIFMPSKRTQVGQQRLFLHQSRLANAVMRARSVTVIGVRPHPVDTHIWGPIAATPAPVYFVGGQTEFEGWADEHRGELPSHFVATTFEASITAIPTLLNERAISRASR
jgi:hypothetical protein